MYICKSIVQKFQMDDILTRTVETCVMGIDCGEKSLSMVILSTRDPTTPLLFKFVNMNERFNYGGSEYDKTNIYSYIDDIMSDIEHYMSDLSMVVIEQQCSKKFSIQEMGLVGYFRYRQPHVLVRLCAAVTAKKVMGLGNTGDRNTNKKSMVAAVKMVISPRSLALLESYGDGQRDLCDAFSYAFYGVKHYDDLCVVKGYGHDSMDCMVKAERQREMIMISLATAQVKFSQYVLRLKAATESGVMSVKSLQTNVRSAMRRNKSKRARENMTDRDILAGEKLKRFAQSGTDTQAVIYANVEKELEKEHDNSDR